MSELTVKQLTEAIKTRKYILLADLDGFEPKGLSSLICNSDGMKIVKELKEIETTLKTIESYE